MTGTGLIPVPAMELAPVSATVGSAPPPAPPEPLRPPRVAPRSRRAAGVGGRGDRSPGRGACAGPWRGRRCVHDPAGGCGLSGRNFRGREVTTGVRLQLRRRRRDRSRHVGLDRIDTVLLERESQAGVTERRRLLLPQREDVVDELAHGVALVRRPACRWCQQVAVRGRVVDVGTRAVEIELVRAVGQLRGVGQRRGHVDGRGSGVVTGRVLDQPDVLARVGSAEPRSCCVLHLDCADAPALVAMSLATCVVLCSSSPP